jgi:CHASE3 domain sensor protein
MKANGKLANRALFASVTIILFLLVIGGVTQRMLTNQKKVTAAGELRYQSRLLADELRQSSDDLTRLARTYVVTADKRYEEQYWAVLDIRNGKSPRPENYDRIYWDFMAADEVKPRPDGRVIPLQQLMEELGFSAEEFAKLKEAQSNSDNLVRMETVAMNAVKGLFDDGFGQFSVKGDPNLEMARQLMHSREYHAEKARIMRPIDEFLERLDRRTSGEVQQLVQQAYRLFYTLLALVVLAVLTLVALCISIFATVVRPIPQVMGELQNTSHQLDAASAQMAAARDRSAGPPRMTHRSPWLCRLWVSADHRSSNQCFWGRVVHGQSATNGWSTSCRASNSWAVAWCLAAGGSSIRALSACGAARARSRSRYSSPGRTRAACGTASWARRAVHSRGRSTQRRSAPASRPSAELLSNPCASSTVS